MQDWAGLAIILIIAAIGLIALARAGKPAREISEEEFERRARASPSLLSAGVQGLQKMLDPAVEKGIEAQREFQQMVGEEQHTGEGL